MTKLILTTNLVNLSGFYRFSTWIFSWESSTKCPPNLSILSQHSGWAPPAPVTAPKKTVVVDFQMMTSWCGNLKSFIGHHLWLLRGRATRTPPGLDATPTHNLRSEAPKISTPQEQRFPQQGATPLTLTFGRMCREQELHRISSTSATHTCPLAPQTGHPTPPTLRLEKLTPTRKKDWFTRLQGVPHRRKRKQNAT